MDAQTAVSEIVDVLGAMDPDRLRLLWDKDRTVEEWKEIASYALVEVYSIRSVLDDLISDDLRNALSGVESLLAGEHGSYSVDEYIAGMARAKAS